MKFESLDIARSWSNRLQNTIKGASYINKDGNTISIHDKDQVPKSKKEIRDALSLFMREQVAKARQSLNTIKDPNQTFSFTAEEWSEFSFQLGEELKFIITQLSASARTGNNVEGLLLLALEEIYSTRLKNDEQSTGMEQ